MNPGLLSISPQFTKNLAIFILKKKVRIMVLRMVENKNAYFDAGLDICLKRIGTQFLMINFFMIFVKFLRMADNVLMSFGEFTPKMVEKRPLRHISNMVTIRYLLTISKVKKMNVSTRMMSLRL